MSKTLNNTNSNYDKNPVKQISQSNEGVFRGYENIRGELLQHMRNHTRTILQIECYPGTDQDELRNGLEGLQFDHIYHSDDYAFEPDKMDQILREKLTNDRVFGVMTTETLKDYFYMNKIQTIQKEIKEITSGTILIYGVGASLICPGDICILAELTRWEIQLRFRNGLSNWRTNLHDEPILSKYKKGFFAQWRWADKQKKLLLPSIDYYLDMNQKDDPVMAKGDLFRTSLERLSREPFRLVPYFDPGVWGGNWMKDKFDLEENGSNYAWSFDGVPEENSLKFRYGDTILETPALNLVYFCPDRLLGERVHARFGAEFPIRFDLLDTMNGQNLSLQVHPLTEYIQDTFNMRYTQDESYYILDAEPDACVYLGVKKDVDKEGMAAALYDAQETGSSFPDDRYINSFPVKKHDHILIPAGTIHGSGKNTMVLEISATPYIFTFKMWDWDRLGLDGLPRPVHLDHALKNIRWECDTDYVQDQLLHQDQIQYENEDCTIVRTGLHEREFIDTYRICLKKNTKIERNGSVHMLNLTEGSAAVISDPNGHFSPFEVHYAETFLVPDGAGEYCITPLNEDETITVVLAAVK